VNQSKMLQQMCVEVLTEAEVRAICKNRGLPDQAASSRPLFAALFISETGVPTALGTLQRTEFALLHLLRAQDKPVDITFFSRLDPPKADRWSQRTFTQRYQGVFAKVKERLVRKGLLLLALEPETWTQKTNMERWRFALPAQFAPLLPPLIESTLRLSGDGDWRSDVAREKLKTAVGPEGAAEATNDTLAIINGELRLGGRPFRADRLWQWQKHRWQADTTQRKGRKADNPYTFQPAESVVHLLGSVEAGLWTDADALTVPLQIFCGFKVDSRAVCESGWRWGCLARQEADGKTWYRLVSPPAPDAAPEQYLAVSGDGGLTVDLNAVPFEVLEKLVMISDQEPVPGGRPLLRLTPNLVKLGRVGEAIAALPVADWLHRNAPAFHQAIETVQQRRGKTIVHENLAVARVSDLTLKVALEKALGSRAVALGEDYLAFPREAVAEVKRLVVKMGHVVKEVPHRRP